jgi:hypothetical protein
MPDRSILTAWTLGLLALSPVQVLCQSVELKTRLDELLVTSDALQATEFSPTSTLSGKSSVVVGGNQFRGNAKQLKLHSQKNYGATTFNYDLRLIIDSSFSGQDLLHMRLRAGNFDGFSNSFAGAGPSVLSQLEAAFQAPQGKNVLAVNRLYYQWPMGEFTVTLGGRVEQDNMFAIWPSAYPSETVLDLMTFGGAIGANNFDIGSGAGIWWQRNGFAISANYVAALGQNGNPDHGGIGTADSGSASSVQIGYADKNWAIATMFSYLQNGAGVIPYGTNFTLASFLKPGRTLAYGLTGYWQPSSTSWLPSISAGWGINTTTYDMDNDTGFVDTSQSWSVGLEWKDAFMSGNSLGMAVGQPTFATSLKGGEIPQDASYVWEWWYKFQLSDNVAVTPGVFYLSRPLGANTPEGKGFQQLGALVKTTFSF